MTRKAKWQTQVDRIKNSDIEPLDGLAISVFIHEFTLGLSLHDHEPVARPIDAALMRLARGADLPDWLDALLDLLYETPLNYDQCMQAAHQITDHFMSRVACSVPNPNGKVKFSVDDLDWLSKK